MALTDAQYEALAPSEQLAYRQLKKSDMAEERNDAKALMSIKVKDPVTRLRRLPLRLEMRTMGGAATAAAACALLGAAIGARGNREDGNGAGPGLGALAGAGIGAGAYLLAAGGAYSYGKAMGNWNDLDKKRLKDFYSNDRFRWIHEYGYADAQLEKLRQESTARRQAAPTQIVL